jgi:hypothetical protein
MFRDPYGGQWDWREIRALIRINLYPNCSKEEGSEFGFGMYWMQFSIATSNPYYRDKVRVRMTRFRDKVWKKCEQLRKR